MESSGSKSLVNPGQSTYIFYVRFNHFLRSFRGGCENPFLIQGTVICGGNSARPALGSINAGTPLTDRLILGALLALIYSQGVCCYLATLDYGCAALIDRNDLPKTPLWYSGSGPFR